MCFCSVLEANQCQVNLTAGYPSTTGCAGMIAAIERVDFPGLCLQDAGHGVHNTDFVHSWPSNIHIGASYGITHQPYLHVASTDSV
jgi:beta-glucosidase